ncbi:MAG: hypothetical protein PVS3B1_22400 [Ktedonobacteraceae bacterium]
MMAASFTTPIVCPVLIGRTSHLETLVHYMEQMCGGRGHTVLITGEAGIGKSRLIAEAITRLRSSQAQAPHAAPLILQGRCFEPDSVLPYAPLLDLLRTFFAAYAPDNIASFLGPAAPELVKLLPELATLVPDLAPSTTLDPEQEKRRLYQALINFFMHLSATQPLLIIVEDVHWSDDTSLEFLLYLARRVPSHHTLLVLTYRSEEVRPTLTRLLAGLDRERLATELLLSRLTTSEVEAMIRAIFALPRPVRADFLEKISTLTEGNPFFLEEILKSLITASEIFYIDGMFDRKPMGELHIPRSVQLAVQQRLDHLSSDARQLLNFAAVAGQRFDFALLQHLMQQNEGDMVLILKELIAAQLVVEESAEVFAFRHALTRQAVYTDLLVRERKVLHRLIAQTYLELLSVETLESHLDDLAYHYHAAGEWVKVLEYAPRAGEKAQTLCAPGAALEHFTHALEAIRHLSLPTSPASPTLPALPALPPLYRARAQAYETLGEFERALGDYQQALDAAHNIQDRIAEWQSLLDLGALWTERDYEQAGNYFQRAITLAREMVDPSALAHTLNRVGNWYANREQPHEGLPYHQEALDIFKRSNDQHGIAETLDFLGTTSLMSNLLLQGIAYHKQAIALWRELENRQVLISSLGMATMRTPNYLSDTLVWLTKNGRECIHDAEEAVALARQIGWRAGEAYALAFLGVGLGSQGEYARAWMCGHTSLNIAREIEHGLWTTFAHFLLGSLSLDLLDLAQAQDHLEMALALAQESGSQFWLRITTGSLASLCIAKREFARAASLLSTTTDTTNTTNTIPSIQTTAQRFLWYARAELELAQHRPTNTLKIIDQLIASAYVEPGGVIPKLEHLRGEALIACKRKTEAEAVLQTAYATAQAQGLRSRLWRISITHAKLAAAQGQREQAEALTTQARTIIEELATNAPDASLRDSFLSCATAQLPRQPALSPRRAAKRTFDGLTEREREVASLVALGMSNRALAEELIVSERTIGKHIERIMSKLGFDSRSQIAAWAVQKGLLKNDL